MQILSSEQIHEWDAFTIQNENITSLDLMERAVAKCMEWLDKHQYLQQSFLIYCGKGNNGADGLALARMLAAGHSLVRLYLLESDRKPTMEFTANLRRLQDTGVEILSIQADEQLVPIPAGAIIIDALFGSGLNRPLDEPTGKLITHLNESGNEIIAIDLPSGMLADKSSKGAAIIQAVHTLTFQNFKLAFLQPENEKYFGQIHLLDIGLSPAFLTGIETGFELLELSMIKAIYKPRKSFSHKGTFGHALLVTGSYGKMGAAILSSSACLRIGVGLLSVVIPACGYNILQTAVPEAMAIPDKEEQVITVSSAGIDLNKYHVVGIGPGIGTDHQTAEAVKQLVSACTFPVVVDADGLNILADNKELLKKLPPFSILSPHPKEFERLFGKSENDFERLELARVKAKELQLIIILKGHKTLIATPGEKAFFNNTGNAGMATGGSGDVLTGILTGLLAQSYTPEQAALLGVYIHGMAGDYAAEKKSQESMIASDIIDFLGDAFLELNRCGSDK